MSEIVERVAKALAAKIFIGSEYEFVPVDEIFPPRPRYIHLHERAMACARIALEAAREPTPDMLEAGRNSDSISLFETFQKFTAINVDVEIIWNAMLHEALR